MRRVLPLVLALLLLPAVAARAETAYERVARTYAEAGGRLDACFFTQGELGEALAGIPKEIADAVPELRAAIREAIATHGRGECAGRQPGVATSPDDPVSSGTEVPPTTTPPATTTTPGAETTEAIPPVEPATGPREGDRTALLVGLIALGALLLALLAIWGLGRVRGWDPPALARARHGWGEAGYRATSTWSEFADWLRLGR